MSQSHCHSGLPVTEKWHVFQNYIMRQKWLMASNLIRGFGRACYSLTLSIMLRRNGYSVKHAHSFCILPRVLAGPGSIYWSIYKPAHATSLIKGDLTDETTYWLSNRIPAVDLRSLPVFISLLSSLPLSVSLTQSNTVTLPLSLTGLPPGWLLQSVWSWSSITADFSTTWNSATWKLPEV